MSWALIAQSAIDGNCSGILAASEDICGHILAEDTCSGLFVFPDQFVDPGFYLWEGTISQALSGEINAHRRIEPDEVMQWVEQSCQPEQTKVEN
jgi:hypothetical protein